MLTRAILKRATANRIQGGGGVGRKSVDKMNDSVLKNSYILDHSTSIIFLHFNLSRSNFVVAFDATPKRDPLFSKNLFTF